MKSLPAIFACIVFLAQGAEALNVFEIRAKSDAPTESDRPGFSLTLFDSKDDDFLVLVHATVPEDFHAKFGALDLVDESGKKLASVTVESENSPLGRPEKSFEFHIDRSLIRNSRFLVWKQTKENGFEAAAFVLATFPISEMPARPEKSKSPPKVWLPLAEFGLFRKYIGTDEFTLSDQIPLEEEQQLGFRLYIRGDGRSVPMKFEIIAPAAPKTWGKSSESIKISADGRTMTWEGMVATEKLVEEVWEIADGDPVGRYQTRIYIRDQLVKVFEYSVFKEREN